MNSRKECSTTSCPFAFNSDESEIAQCCLPSPMEIVNMRVKHGKTWACHSVPDKPCIGAIRYLKSKGLDYSVIDKELITERTPLEIIEKLLN